MIFLAAAIASNISMTFLMKYSENHGGNKYALNIWNYISGALLSILMLSDKSIIFSGDRITLGAGVINGIAYVVALTLLQVNIRRNGAPLTSTFNRLGILVPAILSAFLFHEVPGLLQIAGLVCCVFAIAYINTGGKSERPPFPAGLIMVFLLGGATDFLAKVYSRYYGGDAQTCFVLYTFLAALVVAVIFFIHNGGSMSKQDILIGLLVGIPNQLTSIFILRASSMLPAYIVFPTFSAGIIIFVNVINYLVFKEKLNQRQYIATGLIGIGLVLINLM